MAAPVTPHRSQRPGSFLSGTRATFTPASGPLSPRRPGRFHPVGRDHLQPGTRATFPRAVEAVRTVSKRGLAEEATTKTLEPLRSSVGCFTSAHVSNCDKLT